MFCWLPRTSLQLYRIKKIKSNQFSFFSGWSMCMKWQGMLLEQSIIHLDSKFKWVCKNIDFTEARIGFWLKYTNSAFVSYITMIICYAFLVLAFSTLPRGTLNSQQVCRTLHNASTSFFWTIRLCALILFLLSLVQAGLLVLLKFV